MRSIEIGTALFACLLSACGSSSSDALFGNTKESSCSSAITCGPAGTGGAGGNSAADGGAGSLGGESAGGDAGAGGEESSGGNAGAGDVGNTGGDVASGGTAGGGNDAGASGDPGAGGARPISCPTGDYHAVLMGPYRSLTGTNDVGATIDFSVGESGAVSGSFKGPGNAKATVTGSIDCVTGSLSATIDAGAYSLGLTTARFSGTFVGMYSSEPMSFGGMWVITESGSANYGGNGPWSTS